MEFHEKLQELRKSRAMTQEELAEALFVSRTAISKWESGRGYPSIDSLKEISRYFSVTVDELLSGDKIISIAEKENKANLHRLCDLLFGIVDLMAFLLIVLPLYPNEVDGYVYSVNLFSYSGLVLVNMLIYWALFAALILCGAAKLLLTKLERGKANRFITGFSIGLGVLTVVFLALTRGVYAVVLVFVLLAIKVLLILKKNNNI